MKGIFDATVKIVITPLVQRECLFLKMLFISHAPMNEFQIRGQKIIFLLISSRFCIVFENQ